MNRFTSTTGCKAAAAAAFFCALACGDVRAAINGPYTADANTIYLYHLNESAGASSAANAGSAGFAAIPFEGNPYAGDGIDQPTVTTVLGAAGFSGFGNAANLSAANNLGLGVDVSGNGGFQLDDGDPISADRQADHTSIFGSGNVFTLEAMVNLPAITGSNREIIATDNSLANADRGFQFRVTTAGAMEFNFIGPDVAGVTVPIPTTGTHGFVANEWFHAAMSYDGTNATFYWTRLDPSVTSANQIGSPLADAVNVDVDMILVIGNEGRVINTNVGSTEGLLGLIDEVRISNVVRTAGQFLFSGGAAVQGDYNNNSVVDAADYVLWRNGGPLQNDPTPGVQPEDYNFWRSRFGATSGAGGGNDLGQAAAVVPEPGWWWSAVCVAWGLICSRRLI